MSIFKALVDLGKSEMGHILRSNCRTTGGKRQYKSRTRHDGQPDQRYDKNPNQAAALNKRNGYE